MFGFKQAKAIAAVKQVLEQNYRVATVYRTVPSSFWEDPVVLGTFYGLGGTISRQVVGRLKPEQEGRVLMIALGEVSGGKFSPHRMLHLIQTADSGFMDAARRSSKAAIMVATQSIDELTPEVEAAMLEADGLGLAGKPSKISAVITLLAERWITEPLRERTTD